MRDTFAASAGDLMGRWRERFTGSPNMITRRLALAIPLAGLAKPSWALGGADDIVASDHAVRARGGLLSYTAQVGRLMLRDDDGVARGLMFFVAYRLKGARGDRPVAFFWNGGPGSPADVLHLSGFGPKVIENGQAVDNPDTLLAHADLVFVDPISTGYSRLVNEEDAPRFYDTLGDVDWAARFVRAWRARFAAQNASIQLIGESFGVPRCAGVADALTRSGEPLKGVVLISGGKVLIDAKLPWARQVALGVPTKAATAFFHGRASASAGANALTVRRRARAWALGVYQPALEQRETLTDRQRAKIKAELAQWLGLNPDVVDPRTLVVETRVFRAKLVPGKVLQTYDTRLFVEAVGQAKPDEATPVVKYLRQTLGYKTDLAYWGLEPGQPEVNARWTYTGDAEAIAEATAGGGPPERTPWLSRAIARSKNLRVLVATGDFDSQNARELDQALVALGTPDERRAIECRGYVGGHMMYHDLETRRALSSDIGHFFRARPTGA
jgi:carboxypeptidase C (cathepsin A)